MWKVVQRDDDWVLQGQISQKTSTAWCWSDKETVVGFPSLSQSGHPGCASISAAVQSVGVGTQRLGVCGFYPHLDQTKDHNYGSHWLAIRLSLDLLGLNHPVISEFGTAAAHSGLVRNAKHISRLWDVKIFKFIFFKFKPQSFKIDR